ncbi:MAG: rRNA adenine N-6-methyltransferase family protein, partial [Pseudomonadota bacterium]|nr:rRNA adenine N-6-methyltransferase family protein [Pseudomonadota bacterium]
MNPASGYRSHRPRKRFAQHFLRDPVILRRIVDSFNPKPGENVVEIGPGPGVLTEKLLQRLPHLYAVELDHDLVATLSARFGDKNLRL